MATGRAVKALVAWVLELTTQFKRFKLETGSSQQPPASSPPAAVDHSTPSPEPRLPPPAFYSGEPQLCRSFLAKCSLYISLQLSSFPTEESKIAFIITLLTGRAASWGTTVWEQRLPCCASFQAFSQELKKVFDRAAYGREAARLLAELRQGDRTVADYSIAFRTLSAECGWNSEAQLDLFLHGLSDTIKDEIYSSDLPTGVDKLIELAIRVDARVRRRVQQKTLRKIPDVTHQSSLSSVTEESEFSFPDPEPMQMGRSRLSQQEKQRRREKGLCLYCGAAGHVVLQCPVKAGARQ